MYLWASVPGVILKCAGKYVAEVEMKDSGDVIRIDQAELETVIPQIGGRVLIVNGEYVGQKATLESVNTDDYSAKVAIYKGPDTGTVVPKIDFEDICKLG